VNSPSQAAIRKAGAVDAAAAWGVRTSAILHHCADCYPADLLAIWTDGSVTAEFEQFVADRLYVATLDEIVVGTGTIDCDTGRLDAIFVRPELVRRGIGSQIVSFLEQLGRAAGLTQLTLDSTLNAAPFYRSCGFSGDETSSYRSPQGIDLDCIPMAKVL